MRKLTEGRKMFFTVVGIFLVYSLVFIVFDDFDRQRFQILEGPNDSHLIAFTLIVLVILAAVVHRYAIHMDERISREQAEQQAAIRRELTQDIAHELKTPATSILGYLETLKEHPDIDPAQRSLFVERSLGQAQRLTALLQDITTLQRMDNVPDMEVFEPVDLALIISNVAKESALRLHKRRQTLLQRLPQKQMPIQGNATLLYGIFRNLTDNAIAYAGEGATITISATESVRSWHFTFRDNGPGVPPQHLSRLFDRFYRVDKGRSRKLGGTGLGLAIVKNAVLLHGGVITASNDRGLRFDFTLRK